MKAVLFGSIGLLLLVLLIVVVVVLVNSSGQRVPVVIGGCGGTRWGCCPDGQTSKYDPNGTNCVHRPRPRPRPHKIGGCAGTRYGCCPDGITPCKLKRRGKCVKC